MSPPVTVSVFAPGTSVRPCGRAIVCMLSWITPTFSNTPRTVCITQPDIAIRRRISASPAEASPVVIAPRCHRAKQTAAVVNRSRLLRAPSRLVVRVVSRN
jgi:hypothetical protein